MQKNTVNPNIKHVFVLMLENRSFDHMLGFSKITGTDPATGKQTAIDGADSSCINSWDNKPYPATPGADNVMPFDPGHEFGDVVEQLCGHGVQYQGDDYPPVNNSGFVSNYATTKSKGTSGLATTLKT